MVGPFTRLGHEGKDLGEMVRQTIEQPSLSFLPMDFVHALACGQEVGM